MLLTVSDFWVRRGSSAECAPSTATVCLDPLTPHGGFERPSRQPSRERTLPAAQCIPPPCVPSLACASATGRQQDICACVSVSVSVWSQKVRRLDDSLLPRRLLPAGLWRAGGEGQALQLPLPAFAAAQALSLLPLCPAPLAAVSGPCLDVY